MNKEPTLKEMCKQYKEYRQSESEKISSMNESEQVEYYMKKQEETVNLAKQDNMKTIDFDELFDNEEDK